MPLSIILLVIFVLLNLVACNRGDTAVPWSSTDVATSVPNEFARFINKQHRLSAGEYTAVIATKSVGQSASYTLNISFDDGSSETRTGFIASSSGPGNSCNADKRPCQTITLHRPGGLQLHLDASVASQVSLLDRAGNVVHSAATNIAISSTKVDGESYSNAYYDAIDPANERSNLATWKAKNGFNSGTGTTITATFRDVNDLGYGRHITARKNANGTMAFVVENYLVNVSTDSSANYSALNLDAAVLRAKKFHVGTNAIEFSPQVDGGDVADSIVKFYTFLPGATDARSTRRNSIDMDGRGAKSVPNVCLSCHGGRVLPQNKDGSFNSLALSSAKLNLLDIDSFEPPNKVAFTDAELAVLKEINNYIASSYPITKTVGEWDGSYALDVAQGRVVSGFVPQGWRDDTIWVQDNAKKNPPGTALLYKQVIEPHCYSCHSLQGTSSSSAGDDFMSTAVNFSSYEKFKQFEDEIVEYVYRRGNMPLSLRNYERFWLDSAGAPTLLASHLTTYDIKDASGNRVVRKPGMPFAKAGVDRVAASPVSLNGGGSLLASTYQWSVVSSPSGALTSFTAPNSVQTSFAATMTGHYELQLTVTNSLGSSSDTISLNISSVLASGHKLYSFNTDIRPILGSDTNSGKCTQCHSEGATPLTPVFYTDAGRSAANASSLYSDVMARVNLNDPENSLILQKPAGKNHVGGIISGFASSADLDYQTLLNWIREGALP